VFTIAVIRSGGVDVFDTILSLSVPLLFRPLDRLLGAFLPRPSAGIIITSQRSLAIQRFTAAHELGHFVLGHQVSLDDETILNRLPSSTANYSDVEIAADAFAASFLIPTWLLEIHAERQGWSADSLDDPRIVYQLSLRIGTSYEATCRSLERYKFINQRILRNHLAITPKQIKQDLLGNHKIVDWHSDVWVLTYRDQNTFIQGGPNDVFLIQLKENSGAGYLWDTDQLNNAGFTLVSDETIVPAVSEGVGGAVDRVLIAESKSEVAGELDLKQKRPWEESSSVVDHFTMRYELFGRENGLPRSQREGRVAA
jgi:predicted secreted protein